MLRLVLPKGSLEKATLELFDAADLTIKRSSAVDYRATVDDPRIIEFDVRTDEMLINMGPQHPSTHGVLRLLLRTDGEVVTGVTPHIGAQAAIILKAFNTLNRDTEWDKAADRLIAGFDQINRLVVTDASVREVLLTGEELSPADKEQLYTFANLYCNMWFSAQNAYDNGH